MLEARHVTAAGSAKASPFALPAQDFDGVVHEAVLHQAVKSFLGNQRQGTAATKTRSFVSGGNQKPWKQKGTGRARQGSTRAPHWRGGGTVFGPTPRSYRTELPRKVRQLARRSALNARAREGALVVIERLVFPAPKTSQMAALLDRLGLDGRKVLVLTHAHEPNVYLSGRNLPNVAIRPYREAAPYEVLWSDAVVVEEGALTGVEVVPTEMPAPPAPKVAKAPAEAKPAKGGVTKAAKGPAKKAAPKAEVKAPAKKTAAAKAKAKAPVKKAAGKKAAGGRAKTSPKKKGGK